MKLDGATFLLQWATGGLLFGWVTTRRREVSLGYGWLIRITYGLMAVGSVALFVANDHTAEAVVSALVVVAAAIALTSSVLRRGAGVRKREELRAGRRARVAAMLGRETEPVVDERGPEFEPFLDVFAPIFGIIGLLLAARFAGVAYPLAATRLLVGAAFLGSVTDAMLLGHWYLVQPGLQREPVKELVRWTAIVWPLELLVFLWPVGMVQVLDGVIDDGYDGLLGWIWVVCAVTTIGLVAMTWFALRERYYAAVMAATGLLYLAILTAFGTDLLARAVLKP